jgi:hypothetical protein
MLMFCDETGILPSIKKKWYQKREPLLILQEPGQQSHKTANQLFAIYPQLLLTGEDPIK